MEAGQGMATTFKYVSNEVSRAGSLAAAAWLNPHGNAASADY